MRILEISPTMDVGPELQPGAQITRGRFHFFVFGRKDGAAYRRTFVGKIVQTAETVRLVYERLSVFSSEDTDTWEVAEGVYPGTDIHAAISHFARAVIKALGVEKIAEFYFSYNYETEGLDALWEVEQLQRKPL